MRLLARPVIGMVSRMVDQKGLDLIAAVAGDLVALDATFVIVGTGEPRYQDMWTSLSRRHPDRVGVFVGFDERRAHLVEGGADIFLMPSRFEPCGLNQMYSLRYGTVPVVRAVGGLVDTVRPYNPRNGQGTGFLFADYHPARHDARAGRGACSVSEQENLDAPAEERHARRFLVGPLGGRVCQNVSTAAAARTHGIRRGI